MNISTSIFDRRNPFFIYTLYKWPVLSLHTYTIEVVFLLDRCGQFYSTSLLGRGSQFHICIYSGNSQFCFICRKSGLFCMCTRKNDQLWCILGEVAHSRCLLVRSGLYSTSFILGRSGSLYMFKYWEKWPVLRVKSIYWGKAVCSPCTHMYIYLEEVACSTCMYTILEDASSSKYYLGRSGLFYIYE
jgi:hypothetical protein